MLLFSSFFLRICHAFYEKEIVQHLTYLNRDDSSLTRERNNPDNKPDRATMRPGRVSACIDHVTYMERQMDKQTDKTTK